MGKYSEVKMQDNTNSKNIMEHINKDGSIHIISLDSCGSSYTMNSKFLVKEKIQSEHLISGHR